MLEKIICKECAAELFVEDNLLFYQEAKTMEIANCPACNSIIVEKEISGWIYVSVANPKKKEDKFITFPMP